MISKLAYELREFLKSMSENLGSGYLQVDDRDVFVHKSVHARHVALKLHRVLKGLYLHLLLILLESQAELVQTTYEEVGHVVAQKTIERTGIVLVTLEFLFESVGEFVNFGRCEVGIEGGIEASVVFADLVRVLC